MMIFIKGGLIKMILEPRKREQIMPLPVVLISTVNGDVLGQRAVAAFKFKNKGMEKH